jgi:glycosyltransferase involved in cell wall biosynthesis
MKSEQLFQEDTIVTENMADWRSCWGELKNVHQYHFTPAKKVRFSYEIAPKLRVRIVPGEEHDYTRALIRALPADYVAFEPFPAGRPMDLDAVIEGIDILHVGWVEYLFASPAKDVEKFDAKYFNFIEELGRSRVRIVWTMHNRRPHHMESERGRRLYRKWAPIVDGVIHHSECGMKLMRSELPYRDDAKHVVIPHGHFGEQMSNPRPRAEAEASLGLPPSRMRFGLLGRWQKEKQIEMIMTAFTKAAVPGQQLVVTAYDANTVRPDDPRIIFLPRNDWMTREEIATNTHLCDALVSAHTGDTYLTSGVIADAIGVGIPMVVPHWDFFHEMLGDEAFYHDNTEESLAAAFAAITPEALDHGKSAYQAMQPRFAWPRMAEQTLALYRSLLPKPVGKPAQA